MRRGMYIKYVYLLVGFFGSKGFGDAVGRVPFGRMSGPGG